MTAIITANPGSYQGMRIRCDFDYVEYDTNDIAVSEDAFTQSQMGTITFIDCLSEHVSEGNKAKVSIQIARRYFFMKQPNDKYVFNRVADSQTITISEGTIAFNFFIPIKDLLEMTQ